MGKTFVIYSFLRNIVVHFSNKYLEMRKIKTIILLLVGVVTVALAQDQPSSLQIRLWDNSLFSVILGGEESVRFARTYNVRTIAGGEYYLQITRKTMQGTYPVFEGQIEIPPASRVQAVLAQNGTLEISVLDDYIPPTPAFNFKSRTEQVQSNHGAPNMNADRNQKIEPLEFQELKTDMSQAMDDHQRQTIAIEGLNNHMFTTAYIVQLAKLFRNETSRLEFAKSAYTRTIDPENYFQIKMLFVKEENIQSLDEYMASKANEIVKSEFKGLF